MNSNTVDVVSSNNICISCGICKAVCPKNCIEYELNKGLYTPIIDEKICISCGICKNNCPSINNGYVATNSVEEMMEGNYLEVYNCWSKYDDIRHFAASSGVVTTMIKTLLEDNIYDIAFSVDTFNYENQLKTEGKNYNDYQNAINNKLPKSRYLPVSHEKTIKYITSNKDKKVIIVGTSCALQGVNNVISNYKLNRDNYLLIGLFCDKVFNYNISQYFEDEFADGNKLIQFHFKNKDSGGWPGNLKFYLSNGTEKFVSNVERGKVKIPFMPERCLYCVDKVNVSADISIGDNYTDKNYSEKGTNSLIIRTKRGKNAFYNSEKYLEYSEITMDDIVKAQVFKERGKNIGYSSIKENKIYNGLLLNNGIKGVINDDIVANYNNYIKVINSGANYLDNKNLLKKTLLNKEKVKIKSELKYKVRSTLGSIKSKVFGR